MKFRLFPFFFQSEIAELTGESSEDKTDTKYSEEYLISLEGTKCRSPFTEKWGGHSYHNAVVLNIERIDGKMDLNNPKVIVGNYLCTFLDY